MFERSIAWLLAWIPVLAVTTLHGQSWQQKVNYVMQVDLDHTTHRYRGNQVLTYFNQSPDTLDRVYYHLYFNAFQPGSAMDLRSRLIEDPDPRVADRISRLTPGESGYIHALSLKMDGRPVRFEEQETILVVYLDKPIAPGSKAVLEMTFEGQVPLQIRRSGRSSNEGIDYSMTQWYPKVCAYDRHGWHPNPYIGREFYGEFGDFDVSITMDSRYTLGATGILLNGDEIGRGYETPGAKARKQEAPRLTWKWKAQQVHDFAWAADPDYVQETAQVPGGPLLRFIYQNDPAYAENWKALREKTVRAFEYLSRHYGAYPYPVYSVIQGGDGGMEYPMATLITGNRKLPSLVGVTVHEAAHSWFQGVLGTNESLYAWMDEGFTSYAATETMHFLQTGDESGASHTPAYAGYLSLATSGKEEALDIHADHFRTNDAYGTAAYNKGEVYLAQLRGIVGDSVFRRAMHRYFNQWKFRHPTDEDFLRIMELESGLVLDWYNEYFVHTTKTIDYAITQVVGMTGRTGLLFERKEEMPLPVDVLVTMRSGKNRRYAIPLDLMRGAQAGKGGSTTVLKPWSWVDPSYVMIIDVPAEEIESITLDPDGWTADADRSNNRVDLEGDIRLLYENR